MLQPCSFKDLKPSQEVCKWGNVIRDARPLIGKAAMLIDDDDDDDDDDDGGDDDDDDDDGGDDD